MKTYLSRFSVVLLFALPSIASSAATLYVNVNNTQPAYPYLDWASAATNIQDAIDVASVGDQILVTNGVYKFGSGIAADGTTNRIAVIKPLSIVGVSGSSVTVIDGGGIMRGAYLTNGASLLGFTVTNGNSVNGAGVYCSSTNVQVINCTLSANAGIYGAGVYSGTVSNCTISGNSVGFYGSGAGAYYSRLINCMVTGNSTSVNGGAGAGVAGGSASGCTIINNTCNSIGASVGGGAWGAWLENCTIGGNRVYGAGAAGGGVHSCTLSNCTVLNNRADDTAGGAYNCNLTNCFLSGNYALVGGGVCGGTLVNCVLQNNSAYSDGGGVYWTTTLINCTLTGNSCQRGGGGFSCSFYNCIIYYNTAYISGANTYGCNYTYSCTPDPGGVGNITNAPVFVNQAGGDLRLQAGSGGIDAGTNGYAMSLTDFDGNLRIANGTVDMGAYEYQQPNPATVSIRCNYTNVVVGIPASFQGIFSRGQTDAWDFGDGTTISNQIFVVHTWTTPGDYIVTLTIFDSSNSGGVSGVYLIHVIPPPLSYVDLGSTNPVPPFSSWSTAATNIQDAVDAVIYGAHIVVTNGTYQSGGRVVSGALTNRLVINKPVVVQSANGPTMTIIQGNPVLDNTAVRCVYLTNAATLSGFTLINGATRGSGDGYNEQCGGAVWCEAINCFITNCVLTTNSAAVLGGAAFRGTLNNCSIVGNIAYGAGGGGYSNVLNNCVVSNNQATTAANNPSGSTSGGGLESCVVWNCTIAGNVTHSDNYGDDAGGGANNSQLYGCTISNNRSHGEGGGAANSTLQNCILLGNRADGNGGGGASGSALLNCLIVSNSAYWGAGLHNGNATNCILRQNMSDAQGGGTAGSSLYNCLVTGNSGSVGGGASANTYGTGATLVNCTVYGNSATFRGGGIDSSTAWNSVVMSNWATNQPDTSNWYGGTLSYCCTAPLPDAGTGNITNDPVFAEPAANNFQLTSNSPCINAGTNAYVPAGPDLAGNARIVGGTVDLGPYESQNPALLAFFFWMQSYGLPTAAAAVYADSDGDGVNNYNEWWADTVPTNAASSFRIVSVTNGAAGVTITWSSVTTRSYWLERATDLVPTFPTQIIATNIPGVAGLQTYTDATATNSASSFYRIGVH